MGPRTTKSTEIRVGLFILAALGVLTAFILILANIQFTKGFIVHVDFQSSKTVREGALVRVSGMKAGKVKRIEYRGPDDADRSEDSDRPYLVRISLELDPDMAATIRRETSHFLLTTKGMLGETYVEIHPGHDDGPRITEHDILVVAPYNAQVALVAAAIKRRVGARVRVGTVDKFQGQEGAIAIYTMTSSSRDDAPRDLEFLYSRNRLNVAVSRARSVAVVVASPALLDATCRTPDQIRLLNALCRLVEIARD